MDLILLENWTIDCFDIVSNDSHYIYDLKENFYQVDHNVNVFENDRNKYVGLRDVNTFAADNNSVFLI